MLFGKVEKQEFSIQNKRPGSKVVGMATPQGASLGVFPKVQLWCQSFNRTALLFAEILFILCFDFILERLMTSSVIYFA